MFEAPALSILIVAVIVILGWYAVGTQYNVRIGTSALNWLQKGLPLVGEKATLRWLGSSVVELKLAKAKPPFRSAEVLIALEPRDVPVLWWWGHRRGRRDLLIFRAQLRAAPHFDLEAHSRNAWGIGEAEGDRAAKWTPVQGGIANNMTAEYRGDLSPFSINRLIASAGLDGLTPQRLAVRRAVPNLEVHFLLPKLDQVSTSRVFGGLRDLAEQVLQV